VAVPSSSIDWDVRASAIPIEERGGAEVRRMSGVAADGGVAAVALVPVSTPVANPAFDVTPARLITGLVTERGIAPASAAGLAGLFPVHGSGHGPARGSA
jgi:methylthioribose-1-phosphate isomerase